MTTSRNVRPGQYLTFALGDRPYGVPIGTVREINRATEITPVPQAPKFVAGVVNLRGSVIPVVDLRLKLGMESVPPTKETCIIVMEAEAGQVGVIVDAVRGVIDLAQAQIEPPPYLGDEERMRFVMGMGKVEDQVIVLLAMSECLSRVHFEQVGNVKEADQAA